MMCRVLVLVGVAALGCASRLTAADAPNVVLIVSDDHGWTDYGFMGHPHVKTPNLDKLAAQSLTFRRGYVPSSLCCPSLASLITGRYPHQHKVTSNDPPMPPGMKPAQFQKSQAFLDGREVMTKHLEAVPTLPRLLAQRGYVSLQTGKWWQGDYRRGGFTHGMTKGLRHGDEGLDIGRKTLQPVFDFVSDARKAGKPFLVWYAPMLPHTPHNPPERLLAKYRDKTPSLSVAKYWAMVEWFDETCGQLLDHLEAEKLADNTVVIYVADNGWIQEADALRRRAADADHGPLAGEGEAADRRRPRVLAGRRADGPCRGRAPRGEGAAGAEPARRAGGGPQDALRRVLHPQRGGPERPGEERPAPVGRRWPLEADRAARPGRRRRPRRAGAVRPRRRPSREGEPLRRPAGRGGGAAEEARRLVGPGPVT
jgi:sulfatase-like protein